MASLRVVATVTSDESRSALERQLRALSFIECEGVHADLAKAFELCQQAMPDILIVDLTGREYDAQLFIEAMCVNTPTPCVAFALHTELDSKVVLETVRHGAKEFLQYPADSAGLEAALKRQLELKQRRYNYMNDVVKGKLVSVFSSKGGAGTSTVAVNLAHTLQQTTHEPVMLFDLDQVFSNISVMLNFKPSYSLRDLADNNVDDIDDNLLKSIVVEHESGLHLAVGSKSVLDDANLVSPQLLARAIEYFVKHYAYVVVDLPTHVIDPYHQYLAEQCDEMLLVSSLDIPSLYRTRQYLDLARQHLDVNKIKLVINRHTQKGAYGISNQNLLEEYRFPVHAFLANDWELNVEANSVGKVFQQVNPKSELVQDIKRLADLVSGKAGTKPEEASKGLLGKFLGKKAG